MKERMFSSILLLAMMVLVVKLFGVAGIVGLIFCSGILTQVEFYKLLRKMGQKPSMPIGMSCGIVLMLLEYFQPLMDGKFIPSVSDIMCLITILLVTKVLFSHSLGAVRDSIVSTIAGIIYIPFMCCFPIAFARSGLSPYVSRESHVIFTISSMVFIAKSCDVGSMLAGRYFGKHKLAPNFSPMKTVEGAVGGILVSNLVGIAFLLCIAFRRCRPVWILNMCAFSTILALSALVGDLIESAVKRLANEKDSGTLFPGIGGMFDLTDSLLFALPVGIEVLAIFCSFLD
jgi:phosphatidate cytidylyltransferase